MDITPSIVDTILLPLAISENQSPELDFPSIPLEQGPITQTDSIPSLEHPLPPIEPTWRIDGGEAACFHFFAIPDFARGRAPLQIHVVVPLDQMSLDARLTQSLKLARVFSTANHGLAALPLASHLVQALSFWSSNYPDFEHAYLSMPYGSRIVVETLHHDVRRMRIHLDPSYELERRWLSAPEFGTQTGLDLGNFVSLVDWGDLELDRQLHESVTLVRVPTKTGPRLMAYKSVTADLHYMYHELRVMLSMRPHPMVVPRPRYVVVKKCRFGAKTGICGFLLEYHTHGNLQGALQEAAAGRRHISLLQKVYWARNLIRALIHVRDSGPGFYSDLKPDNVLLRPTAGTGEGEAAGLLAPLLIDFEQRGSWYGWSPPEVQYVEFLNMLATKSTSESVRSRYSGIMQRCVPGWRSGSSSASHPPSLAEAADGFSLGWTALDPAERRSAQVFSVGKLMWCIFEELPSCNSFLSIETFAEGINQGQRFPQFHKTPAILRELIHCCTASASEWRDGGFPIQRKGDKLIPWRHIPGAGPALGAEAGQGGVQRIAQEWWKRSISAAEDYVERRYQDREGVAAAARGVAEKDGARGDGTPSIPALEEIMEVLRGFSPDFDLANSQVKTPIHHCQG